MRQIGRAFLTYMVVTCLSLGWVYGQQRTRDSAWDQLLQTDPAAADDPTIGWQERLILYALTPEQADAYFNRGADPQSLLLEDGRTLKEYLDARIAPPASVYVALPVPCTLFTSDQIEAGARYNLRVRGEDLGAQGGSATGCGIPDEATAVILNLRLEGVEAGSRVRLWAADGPEPAEAALQTADGSGQAGAGTLVVSLAAANDAKEALMLHSSSSTAVTGEVIGYFRALRTGDSLGGGTSFYTEGGSNNFFGDNAGASNSSVQNSFFGAAAGAGNTFGQDNSFFGYYAGRWNTTGDYNSFFGFHAGSSNTGNHNSCFGHSAGRLNGGSYNAFFGSSAGYSNTSSDNSFFGSAAGYSNTTGSENSAFGRQSLHENQTGDRNTAIGNEALYANVDGSWNTAVGAHSLEDNTTGYRNTALGDDALAQNTTGYHNTAIGENALYNNIDGIENAGLTKDALYSNTSGSYNTAAGEDALFWNTTGNQNTAVGEGALQGNTEGSDNSALGRNSGNTISTGQGNSLLGAESDGTTTLVNSTAVGYRAYVSQSNSLVLGSIAGVNDASADVKIGIGTTAPAEALHVVRSDGTAMVKVEETSGTTANRVLFRLTNNGAPWFKLLNSNTAQEWTFAMDQYDNFIFSKIGTGGAEFKIYKSGQVTMGPGGSEVFDLQPTGDLEITGGLTAGGIYYASDRNKKTDIEPLDSTKVLETIAQLPVSTWRFKTEDAKIRHAGPMAQDFYAAFGLGSDDKTISASDISGVALAAIQGLYRQNMRTTEELARRDSRIAAQERKLATQAERIKKLEAQLAEMDMLKAGLRKVQTLLAERSAAPSPDLPPASPGSLMTRLWMGLSHFP